jgi:hypothetical protein
MPKGGTDEEIAMKMLLASRERQRKSYHLHKEERQAKRKQFYVEKKTYEDEKKKAIAGAVKDKDKMEEI